jgi:hypothetical protein
MPCPHIQPNYTKDIVLMALVFVALLVLREFLSWMFKTNHMYAHLSDHDQKLDRILRLLQR